MICFARLGLCLRIDGRCNAAPIKNKVDDANSVSYASAMPAQRESEETAKLHHRSQTADTSNQLFPIGAQAKPDPSRLPAVCLTISVSKVRW